MTFDEAYKTLNKAQKQAVDTIDGPIMVVAGPGTGKTQLLATRAANILKKDSTLLPTNVLCLTFTESGQIAMQRRLVELMGEAGAHVAVHTFHSFGTEIINNYPQYFYMGANYSPADDLTTHEILSDILKDLPHRNQLSTKNQGEFVYLRDIKDRISKFKMAAVTPEELKILSLDAYNFAEYIEPQLFELFDVERFYGSSEIKRAEQLLLFALKYQQPQIKIKAFKPLSEVFIETFSDCLALAKLQESTKPINNFKKDWFAKDKKRCKNKQLEIASKLIALGEIYQFYQNELDKKHLFDYDDMIMRVVHALEKHGDLAYELQEQYQYFLIDEFQDTNAGQLRLLTALAEHPVNEDRPNVMVVGDDDQAIYAFQGAELSNILDFKESYREVKLITLTENYRSDKNILTASREVIKQGVDRLENRVVGLDKTLTAKASFEDPKLARVLFNTQTHEFEWVADEIKNLMQSGHQPKEIAVICREHKHLENLLPYLYANNIPVSYERRKNALSNSAVEDLVALARVVSLLSLSKEDEAEGYLAQVLSADYWSISAEDIWKLSLLVRKEYEQNHKKIYWLELMKAGKVGTKLKSAADFLIEVSKKTRSYPLEEVLDMLIGNNQSAMPDDNQEEGESYEKPVAKVKSPFKDYYFKTDLLKLHPEKYIDMLACLTAIRNHLRSYHPNQKLKLEDFVNFVDLCNEAKINIKVSAVKSSPENSVVLTTAHGSKGLEFETVFLMSAVSKVWANNGKNNLLPLSPNMLSVAHSDNADDRLRLFYVSMTRAKKQLYISSYLIGDDGKEVTNFAALEDKEVQAVLPPPKEPTILEDTTESLLNRVERMWYDKHFELPRNTMKELLNERLQNYRLSVTHLINYLDVTKGGPNSFLLNNLLQFPSAMSPSSAYGSAMHDTFEYLHNYYSKNENLPELKATKEFFEKALKFRRLSEKDEKFYFNKGKESLALFIDQKSELFNKSQLAEQSFYTQGVSLDDARLTGKLDVLDIQKNKAKVIDYKTGKAFEDWREVGKSLYEKIKMHQYRQQLYFYKLLVEGSRKWGDRGVKLEEASLIFVEPVRGSDIISLSINPDDNKEIDRLNKLIKAVWDRIQNLEFIDTSEFASDISGIIEFEDWLIENK